MANTDKVVTEVNTKKMLKDLATEGRKIKFNDRQKLEIIKDSGFYKKGQVIEPHRTFAETLIKDKIAKAVK